jgi:CBS domain-containing protein
MNRIESSLDVSPPSSAHPEQAAVSRILARLSPEAQQARVTEAMRNALVGVDPDLEVRALMRLFLEHGTSAAPVVDAAGMPVGIVSKTDIVRDFAEQGRRRREPRRETSEFDSELPPAVEPEAGRRVRHVMTPVARFVTAETSIARAAAIMAYERIHRVVVVDRDYRVVGVLSALDVLRWLGQLDA